MFLELRVLIVRSDSQVSGARGLWPRYDEFRILKDKENALC